MTVTIDVPYRTYEIRLRGGQLVLGGLLSPMRSAAGKGPP
jgi:hypothetical protein